MGDKSVETLCNEIEFLSILVTVSPFPPKQCWLFYFFDCTYHSAYTTLNWGAGDIRELTLEANKIEQMLKYRKASFPKSVSTTFVAHCCFWIISALEANKWSQITLCILINVLTSIYERFCPNFEQIYISRVTLLLLNQLTWQNLPQGVLREKELKLYIQYRVCALSRNKK